MTIKSLICLATAAFGSAWAQGPSLSLLGGPGVPGGTIAIAFNLAPNNATITGLEWTLNYSSSDFTSVILSESVAASAALQVLFCSPKPGQVTCALINPISPVIVSSGQIAVATFQISPTTTSLSSLITLSNLSATTGAGDAVALNAVGLGLNISQPGGGGLGFAGSMAQLASGGGWDTTLTLVNTGAASTESLNFLAEDGTALQLPFTFPQAASTIPVAASTLSQTLNANSLLVLDSRQSGNGNPEIGSAHLLTNGKIGGFAIYKYTPTGQEAVVPLETRNAPSYVLAFDNTGVLTTGVAIANVAAQAAAIPVVIRDDAGRQIGTDTISLAAQGHTSFLLPAKYAITTHLRGTIEFDTPPSGQITALGLRANGNALTTLPVLANVKAGGGSMGHVASGGGWQTTFTVVNTGTAAAQIQMSFLDNNGGALALPLTFAQTGTMTTEATLTQTIAAGASLVIVTQADSAAPTVVGSAQLTSTGNVSGFAIFRYNPTGQEAVVPLETRNSPAYVLAFDNTNGLVTGLALANVSNQAVAVPVILRDDTGASLGSATINLAAHGHTSFLLKDSYAATGGKRGTVEFDTPVGAQISALGLRATSTGATTTIPVLVK